MIWAFLFALLNELVPRDSTIGQPLFFFLFFSAIFQLAVMTSHSRSCLLLSHPFWRKLYPTECYQFHEYYEHPGLPKSLLPFLMHKEFVTNPHQACMDLR